MPAEDTQSLYMYLICYDFEFVNEKLGIKF